MIYNYATWCSEMQTILQLARDTFKVKEIDSSGIEYLSNLFSRIESGEIELELDLQRKIDNLMKEFPKKMAGRFLITSSYINQLSNIKKLILKRHNLYYKGYHRTMFLPLGMGIGLALGSVVGLLLGKYSVFMPLGLPVGISFGFFWGVIYEKRASLQNRVL